MLEPPDDRDEACAALLGAGASEVATTLSETRDRILQVPARARRAGAAARGVTAAAGGAMLCACAGLPRCCSS